MRVLVVHAHPVEASFNRALFLKVSDTLAAGGHEVDALDLYAEGFTPALSRAERIRYEDVPGNIDAEVAPHVERLRAAQGIVFVYPVWNYGFPAILKGWLDRVFLPGVSFTLAGGKVRPALDNIRRAAFVTSYGGGRWRTMVMGDPPRRLARRWAWATFRTPLPPKYLALYGMDVRTEPERKAFLARVGAEMARW